MIRNEQLISHAYEEALSSAARLSAFANTRVIKSYGLIEERQEILAIDDITKFAYNTRRLLELTNNLKQFSTLEIHDALLREEDHEITFTRLLNRIVHHRDINLMKTEYSFQILKANDPISFLVKNKELLKQEIPTLVLIKSKKHDYVMFRLAPYLEYFENDVLSSIINECAENGLFLEGWET